MDQTQDLSRTRSALRDLSAITNIQSSSLTQIVDNLKNAKEGSIRMSNVDTDCGKQTKVLISDVDISPINTVKFESAKSCSRFQPKYTSVSYQDSSMEQENKLVEPSIEFQSILDIHTDTFKVSSNSKTIMAVPHNTLYSAEDKHSHEQETNNSSLEKRKELLGSLQNVFKAREISCELKTADLFNLAKKSELKRTLSEEQLISQTVEATPIDTSLNMGKTFSSENDFIMENKIYNDNISVNNKSLLEYRLDDEIRFEHFVNNNIGEQIVTAILYEIIDSVATRNPLQIEHFVIENNKSIGKNDAQMTGNILNEETSPDTNEKLISISDEEFISGDTITEDFFTQQNCDLFQNPQDFEFLMKKGTNKPSKNKHNTRTSILANFDPFFVQCSPVKQTINISGSSVANTVDKDFSPSSKHKVIESRKEGDKFSANMLTTCDSNNTIIDHIFSILENLPKMDVEKAVDEVNKIKLFLVENVKKNDFVIAEQDFQRHIVNQEQEECRREINSLQSQIQERDCNIAKILQVINEYDQIVHELVNDISSLSNECDETKQHLRSGEMALADVQLKFEKSSEIIWTMKSKQELALKAEVVTAKKFEERETDYKILKTETMQKLQSLNEDYMNAISNHKKQVMVLDTMIKKSTIENASLQRQLEQKLSEQKELSEMVDGLVESVQNH